MGLVIPAWVQASLPAVMNSASAESSASAYGPTLSPMNTVLVNPPIPLMKAGREQCFLVISLFASTTAAAPVERGQMSKSLYGQEIRGDFITSSTVMLPL